VARIALVEPRSSGHLLIDTAADLGHEVVVLTANRGGRRIPPRHLARADRVVTIDTNDDDQVVAITQQLHTDQPFDAVVPGFEHYVPLAARLASVLGLRGLHMHAAMQVRHKHRMREGLSSAGVAQPAWALAADEGELSRAVDRVGLPCVVKPVDLSGSLHVRKAATAREARDAFLGMRGRSDPELDRVSLPLALVEEYVAGPEYSVEGFVADGTMRVLTVTEKLLGAEPFFVEVGHIVPGDLPAAQQGAIEAYIGRVVRALGLSVGPFHAEVRLSDRGPLLIEIAARLGGDQIPQLVLLAHGVDLHQATLHCYLGQPLTGALPAAARTAGVRFFLRPQLHRYTEMVLVGHLRADRRIREVAMLVPPGTDVPAPESSRGRLGYAVVTGASQHDVRTLLDDVDRQMCFR